MGTVQLTRELIQPVVDKHTGNRTFGKTLTGIATPAELVRVLGRYIQFNGIFGGGVANLAGELAVRRDLFRDPGEPIAAIADKCTEVASHVFAAAIDEFDDRRRPHLDTHRMLAQATFKATCDFFKIGPAEADKLVGSNPATQLAIARVLEGYGVSRPFSDQRLFRSLGFHMGSEILADVEFNVLDEYLKTRQPELAAYLEKTEVPLSGNKHNAYYWVFIHTSVEADHFDYAAKAANMALHYYAGQEPPETVQGWVLDGFSRFGEVQSAFMAGLTEA